MASRLQLGGDKTVLLRVTHSNIKDFSSEVRFDLEMSVEAAKEKLWKKCGTSVDSMLLVLYDDAGSKICDLSDNARPLGFYFPLNGYHIKVIDQDPSSVSSGGWLDDTSLVEKYKISEEAYNKLNSNFRKFKEKMLSQNAMTHEKKLPENYVDDLCKSIKVGDRCEVEPGEKRGVVKFVGKVENRGPGFWIGIQLDEPLGKHDGMVNGKRYFECLPQHGIFLRPEKVKVGDYPERDPFDEEEI
ncbi:hypothetical protein KFK09_007140 [Dendrobium nobile]|uniref:CAP-Gly domain-containing protein n=1 Tax=Dendrobium nobile TaxID=94219 RepID=A0A8T3BR46_DENNO|nr:hypothetical protein KFK09_007140 [Dendrobium nobile]